MTTTDSAPVARPVRAGRVALVAIGVLVLARVVAVVVLLRSGIEHPGTILGGDTRRYLEILHSPGTPYRDRAVEYTPLTLAFLWVVDRGGVHATLTAVAWSQLALELSVAGLLAWAWSRRVALWYLLLGTPMLVFPFPYARIDLLSVALAVLAMALVRRSRPGAAGVALGAAVLAKVWPLAIAPVLLVRRRWVDVATAGLVLVVGLTTWVAWAGTDGPGQVQSFRGARGWQIESLPGLIGHAIDPGASRFESGAWRSGAVMTPWARVALLLASAAVIAWAWWRAARTDDSPDAGSDAVDVAAALSVTTLLVFAPILSPQYVLWLLPFAAIVIARGDRIGAVLALLVSACTTGAIAWIHQLTAGDAWAIAVVAVRNLALVALGVHLAARLVRLGQRERVT